MNKLHRKEKRKWQVEIPAAVFAVCILKCFKVPNMMMKFNFVIIITVIPGDEVNDCLSLMVMVLVVMIRLVTINVCH